VPKIPTVTVVPASHFELYTKETATKLLATVNQKLGENEDLSAEEAYFEQVMILVRNAHRDKIPLLGPVKPDSYQIGFAPLSLLDDKEAKGRRTKDNCPPEGARIELYLEETKAYEPATVVEHEGRLSLIVFDDPTIFPGWFRLYLKTFNVLSQDAHGPAGTGGAAGGAAGGAQDADGAGGTVQGDGTGDTPPPQNANNANSSQGQGRSGVSPTSRFGTARGSVQGATLAKKQVGGGAAASKRAASATNHAKSLQDANSNEEQVRQEHGSCATGETAQPAASASPKNSTGVKIKEEIEEKECTKYAKLEEGMIVFVHFGNNYYPAQIVSIDLKGLPTVYTLKFTTLGHEMVTTERCLMHLRSKIPIPCAPASCTLVDQDGDGLRLPIGDDVAWKEEGVVEYKYGYVSTAFYYTTGKVEYRVVYDGNKYAEISREDLSSKFHEEEPFHAKPFSEKRNSTDIIQRGRPKRNCASKP